MNSNRSLSVLVTLTVACMLCATPCARAGQPVTNVTSGNGYATIQEAIDDATTGDEIVISPGTHIGPGNTNVSFGGKDVFIHGATGNPADVIIDCLNIPETRGIIFDSGETSAAILADVTITNGNMSTGPGGGIFINNSSPTIQNCVFVSNHTAVWGGGLFHDYGNAIIIDCTFLNNTGVQDGGGMFNGFGDSSVINCTFIGNSARNGGGLIMNAGGTEVTGCTFIRNAAAFNSGGLHIGIEGVPVTNCKFLGNTAVLRAGGLFTGAGICNVNNCLFVGNTSAQDGGGLFNSTATANVNNCTFAYNTANDQGGGLFNDFGISNVSNSIFFFDISEEVFENFGNVSVTHCNVQGGYDGIGIVDEDPDFIQTPDEGLDGSWGTDDDDYGDLHIGFGSPCIDAGDNSAVPLAITADLDGNPRFVDEPSTIDSGNGVSPMVDIGAYEFQPQCLGDTDNDGDVDINDLRAVILQWGNAGGSADVDLSGTVEVNDLRIVILNWGLCP